MAFVGLRVSIRCTYPHHGDLHTFIPQRTFVAQDANLTVEVL